MLAKVSSCLLSWLLLAALSPHVWRATVGTPLKAREKRDTRECVTLSRALLSEVNRTFAQEELFEGFNCSEIKMIVNRPLYACDPSTEQDGGCSGAVNTKFNKEECLRNIRVDLETQRDKLRAYQREELYTVTQAIQNLLEGCSFPAARRRSSPLTPTTSGPLFSTTTFEFETRQRLCAELKGFHVRSITIARVLGYMAA